MVVLGPLDSSSPPSVTADGGVAVASAVPPRQAEPRRASPPSREAVAEAVDKANAALSSVNRSIEFTIDPDTRAVIVRVIDKQDNRVLRQVPSAEMLEIAKALDRLQGVLLRSEA